jgi:hypothetical protein
MSEQGYRLYLCSSEASTAPGKTGCNRFIKRNNMKKSIFWIILLGFMTLSCDDDHPDLKDNIAFTDFST